jgi:hypothetical protein
VNDVGPLISGLRTHGDEHGEKHSGPIDGVVRCHSLPGADSV